MKVSSATSAKAGTGQPQPTGRSSDRRANSLTDGVGFGLTGPSRLPDPTTSAYRRDLADAALAGTVIASHFAEPLPRVIAAPTRLRAEPSDQAEVIAELGAGEPFAMLDNARGWAWGYAGAGRRVGYVASDTIAPA